MKVWIGYECSDLGDDIWRGVAVVFATEQKAINWVDAGETTEWDWRDMEEWDVV